MPNKKLKGKKLLENVIKNKSNLVEKLNQKKRKLK